LGVKLAVWLPTIKSRELTQFPCVQMACNLPLKSSQWGLQLCLDLISIGGLHTKLLSPKLQESQLWEFRNSHLGVPRQNDIWVLVSWLGTEYTISPGRGLSCESVVAHGSSRESVVARGSSMHQNVPTMH
jgi:hypothetical protein